MADKFTQLALTVCLSAKYPVLVYVLILFLTKEFFQFFAALIHYRVGKALDGALMEGKICTSVLFVSLTLLVVVPQMNERAVNLIALVDEVFLVYAFLGYVFAFFGRNAKVRDIEL